MTPHGDSYRIALAIKLDGTATGCLNAGYGQQLHDLLKEASRALLDSNDGPSERDEALEEAAKVIEATPAIGGALQKIYQHSAAVIRALKRHPATQESK